MSYRNSDLIGFLLGMGIALLLLSGITALAWLYSSKRAPTEADALFSFGRIELVSLL